MEILTENKIKQYRARSILYTAFPQYRTKFDDPIYWKDGIGKKVDPHGLEESLQMTGENIARHLNGQVPDYILFHVARKLGFSKDELAHFEPEEILEGCIRESYFLDVALSYISNYAMKKLKNDIHDCMPCRAIDSYALQLAEDGIRCGFTTMGMKVTKSKKSPFVWMVDIPNKKLVENTGTRKVVKPHSASNIIKVGLGSNGRMRPQTEDFAVNIIPTVKRNLNKYRDALYMEYQDFMNDLVHSAEVLDTEL
jgi:hypothetical protein